MILPTCLPLLALVAGSVPLTVEDARADLHDGQLEVTVTTSGPLTPSLVHPKLRSHHLVVYVDGAQVPERMLGTEKQPVIPHPRPTYAKLEIPLPSSVRCAGPIDVRGGPDGARVTVACEGAGRASGRSTVAATAVAAPAPALAVAPAAHKAAPAAAMAPASGPAPAQDRAALQAPPPPPPPPVVAPVAAAAPAPPLPPAAPQSSAGSSVILPVLLLLLGAAVAALLWKRRRTGLGIKRIRIIETAPLGPKRALILAEVNGATMVIGTSEAGISLLSQPQEGVSAGPPIPEPTVDELGDASEPSLTPTDQGGALARLFPRRTPAPTGAGAAGAAYAETEADEDEVFAAMLRETLEDQELRTRLGRGLAGKVT